MITALVPGMGPRSRTIGKEDIMITVNSVVHPTSGMVFAPGPEWESADGYDWITVGEPPC